MLITGRHGDWIQQVENPTATTLNIFDPQHVTEDQARIAQVKAAHADINIEMVDAATAPTNQVKFLRDTTTAAINAGKTVIWAWCFSFMANVEADKDAPINPVLKSHYEVFKTKTIATITQEDFTWCPRPV